MPLAGDLVAIGRRIDPSLYQGGHLQLRWQRALLPSRCLMSRMARQRCCLAPCRDEGDEGTGNLGDAPRALCRSGELQASSPLPRPPPR
jgi:hypothetical protein